MAIDLSTFWGTWDVVSGNTSATNQYEFWKGIVMSTGQVLANQYEFFQYHNTTRYEWFRDLQSTYPEVYDEYTFYKNTNDPDIYDMRTFYEFGAKYLNTTPVTPTPTPTFTPTPSVTPPVTPTNTPSGTPAVTPTPTSSPTGDPDAQAYLAAVVATGGTVTSDITTAVETLFTQLKSNGLYSKLDILMPMVGGVKSSILINAKTPTNNLYKWTEFGAALTYNVSGVTGNSTGALKSNFTLGDLSNIVWTSAHFGVYYNKLSTEGTGPYFNGFLNTDQAPYTYFNTAAWVGNLYGGMFGQIELNGIPYTPQKGWFMRNRTSSSSMYQYLNNADQGSSTSTTNQLAADLTRPIALFALGWSSQPNGLYAEGGNAGICTVTLGSGLDSTERANLNTIITNFNTTLGRS